MSQQNRMPMRPFDGQMDIFGSMLSPASSFLPPSSSPLPGQSPSNSTQQIHNTMSQPKRIRRGAKRVNMPIKILYNLDSNPNATMVAQIEQRMPVDVLPIKRKTNKDGNANGTPVFARVSLKVCLQGICMASPELLSSTIKDYVLYAVDPVEAHRANLRRETASGSSGSQEASPSRGKSLRSSAAFMVGKGYMSQALTQEGMGVSTVHGRVRGEFDDEDEEDEEVTAEDEDDEEFWDSRVLEVSLKLNVSSPPEITLLEKASQETKMEGQSELATSSKPSLKRNSTAPAEPLQAISSNQVAKEISADASQVSKGQSSRKPGPQRQLLHLLQALQAHAQQGSSSTSEELPVELDASIIERESVDQKGQSRTSKNNRIRFSSPSTSSSATTSLHPNGAQSSPVMANHNSLQHSVPWPSTSKRPKPRASAPSFTDAQSPILGGLTPGYEADYLSGPSPSNNAEGNQLIGSSRADLPKITGIGGKMPEQKAASTSTKDEQCYNCGLKGELYWRYLHIPDESDVKYYNSSVCFYNGTKSFRSCNACGTYFSRYRGISRPEFVIKEHEAKRLEKLKRITSQNTSSASSEEDNEEKGKKKSSKLAKRKSSSFSRTLSEACAVDSKRLTDDPKNAKQTSSKVEQQEEEIEPNQKKIKKRKLSHSDKEDSKKGQSQERKFVENFEKARLRDLVMDQDGNWRSKRSILENPTNRRVGRPPGRKTGCGLGRQRNAESAKAAAAALKEQFMKNKEKGSKVSTMAPATDPMPEADVTNESAVTDALQAILSSSSPLRPNHVNQVAGASSMQLPSFAVPYAPNQMMHQQMPHSTPGRSSSHQNKTPMSVSRVRYGAPAHLMMSSPATAFQTVMDEADTDWKALFGIGANNATRRSPRKKPAGVHGGINPYATNLTSPSRLPVQRQNVENFHQSSVMDPDILMQMTSSSPLTRNRVKSGQFEWAFNSSDDVGTQKKKVSSAITSPTSPSPTRTRILSSKRKVNPNEMMLEAGPIGNQSTSRKSQVTKQAKHSKEEELNSFDNEPFAGYTAINLSGLDQDDEDHIDDDEEEGPGSPTLGRSRRLDKKKKNAAEMRSTPTANGLFSSTPSDLGNNVDLVGNQTEWQQNATIPELFPSTSPEKAWNVVSNGSPSQLLWNSPSSWALRMPTPSPIKTAKQTSDSITAKQAESSSSSGAPNLSVTTALQEEKKGSPFTSLAPPVVQKRKPLPATVEDASPSEASNPSPNEDEEDEEDEEEITTGENGEMLIDMTDGDNLAALMEMFEDPYGLLAASGINLPVKSDEAEQTSKQTTAENNLAHVELFKSFDYAKELGFFNQAGASGIAANAGPSAPTTIENSSKNTTESNMSGGNGVMAEMKNMLSSPHKIEIDGNFLRISPRKKSSGQHNQQQPISSNSEINFGDWIWSDVQKTPTKQSAL